MDGPREIKIILSTDVAWIKFKISPEKKFPLNFLKFP